MCCAAVATGSTTGRFLRKLKRKVRAKADAFPEAIDLDELDRIRTLREFDEFYTGPQHGFASAKDYYVKSGSLRFLAAITTPTLLVNALNDPFLEPGCFPYDIAEASRYLHLETPRWGGHTGFRAPGEYWSERAGGGVRHGGRRPGPTRLARLPQPRHRADRLPHRLDDTPAGPFDHFGEGFLRTIHDADSGRPVEGRRSHLVRGEGQRRERVRAGLPGQHFEVGLQDGIVGVVAQSAFGADRRHAIAHREPRQALA